MSSIIQVSRHVVIPPIMQIRVLAPRSAAAAGWWVVPGKTCVAAYQPKGAASQAASYVNLANPGTNDAAPGTAPSWNTATGWTFDGATTYLTTGVIPARGWSLVAQVAAGASNFVVGELGGARIGIRPLAGGNRYYMGSISTGTAGRNSGNVAVCNAQGYWNGAADGAGIAWSVHVPIAMFIGAENAGGTAGLFFTGTVVALAFYSGELTAGEIAVLAAAMAAL